MAATGDDSARALVLVLPVVLDVFLCQAVALDLARLEALAAHGGGTARPIRTSSANPVEEGQ